MDEIKERLASIKEPMTSSDLSLAIFEKLKEIYPRSYVSSGAVKYVVHDRLRNVIASVKVKRKVVGHDGMKRLYKIEFIETDFSEPTTLMQYMVEIYRGEEEMDKETIYIKEDIMPYDVIKMFNDIKDAKIVISRITTKKIYVIERKS